jgi:ribosome-associated protein
VKAKTKAKTAKVKTGKIKTGKVKATKARSVKAAKKKTPSKSKITRTPAAKKTVKLAVKRGVKAPQQSIARPAPLKLSVAAPAPQYPALVAGVLAQLADAKAEQVVTIDLKSKSSEADFMIVASGRSNRHVNAIADQIVQKLEGHGQKNLRVEGIPQCDWVLVDAGDVIVHIFRPEVRSYYNLEKLWSERAPHEGMDKTAA